MNCPQKRCFYFFLLLIMSVIVYGALSSPQMASAQDPTKPDIHLSFLIKEDGSNTTSIEIAVNPLIDPLIKRTLEYAAKSLTDNKHKGKSSSTYEITTTTREGREYHALVIHYNSLGDLNALINTPKMLSGVFGDMLSDASLPQLFSKFSVTLSEEKDGTVYRFVAFMEPETTRALAFANVTIHVFMPGKLLSQNALQNKNGELIWRMTAGESLDISAVSQKAFHLGGFFTTPSKGGIIGAVLVLVALALVIGGLLIRRGRSQSDDEDEDWYYEDMD